MVVGLSVWKVVIGSINLHFLNKSVNHDFLEILCLGNLAMVAC